MLLRGDSRILEVYYKAAWVPIGCLTDNSFNESVQSIGTTTRNSASWKTSLVTKQNYSINFTGIESDGAMSTAKLKELKRLRELIGWRIGSDSGFGYITSIGDSNPAGDLVTFNGEIVGYGIEQFSPPPLYGPDIIVNGGFDTDSNWNKAQATISGGKAFLSTTDGSLTAINQLATIIGKDYFYRFDIADIVGTIVIDFDEGNEDEYTTNGTKTGILTAGNPLVQIQGKAGETVVSATIDNVSVKEVL